MANPADFKAGILEKADLIKAGILQPDGAATLKEA